MHLQNFRKSEFREWYDLISPRLTTMLDILRYQTVLVVEISSHPDSIGRSLGPDKDTCHNVDRWSWVLAVDCFVGKNTSYRDAKMIINVAKSIGFTGIGIYPYWTNNYGHRQCGFHFDVRPSRNMGDPASWGFFEGEFTSTENALAELTKL